MRVLKAASGEIHISLLFGTVRQNISSTGMNAGLSFGCSFHLNRCLLNDDLLSLVTRFWYFGTVHAGFLLTVRIFFTRCERTFVQPSDQTVLQGVDRSGVPTCEVKSREGAPCCGSGSGGKTGNNDCT